MLYLGIDTSNYTTSAAVFDSESGCITQEKQLLPVKAGEKGLRQSEAVFHHTVQLPAVLSAAVSELPLPISAVGASAFPRRAEGSYMPCFMVGKGTASAVSAAGKIPLYTFSHQEGHIAAALYSANCLSYLKSPFLAFHISGGTTEALLVKPDTSHILSAACVARSLDLKAGQLIDRVGVLLGLAFPCGAALDKLAQAATKRYTLKPTLKGADCCLSGLENRCKSLLDSGESPENTAAFCIAGVLAALCGMTEHLKALYPDLPLVFSGGVASNSTLRRVLSRRYAAVFAEPAFSADNAAGIAVLSAIQDGGLRI